MKEVLSCKNLAIGYKKVLKSDLSLSLNRGEVIYLKGNNGSGKTTLIKTLLGELRPHKGSVNFNIKKEYISYLPQITNPEAHFSYTLGEMLNIYQVSDDLNQLFSSEVLNSKWVESSGGEKQKAMILTKIKENTELLILDEPFNHLDSQSISLIINLLSTLIKSKRISSLLLVSHLQVDIEGFKSKEIVL